MHHMLLPDGAARFCKLRSRALLLRLAVRLRVQVIAALSFRLVFFDLNTVLIRKGIPPDACDLPGDLHPRLAPCDLEVVIGNLVGDVNTREPTDAGKLVAK